MGFKVKATFRGLQEVTRRLNRLAGPEAKEVERKAVFFASQPLMEQVRENAKFDTGLMAASIGRRQKTYRNSGITVVVIGPRRGFKREVVGRNGRRRIENPSQIAHLLEDGTRRMRAKRFIYRAINSTKAQVQERLETKLVQGIERELLK